ncbi:MAG: hypothetical protein M9916_13500 [Crocinitomicaceae bacterium]|nr:hypothetical protein [Crocinitomicaceae bacterium]
MDKKRIIKILKWFFGILLGLIMLITAGVYYFKDEIIGIVIEEVNSHLKAKVKVEKVDLAFWSSFPNLSVDFNQVFIHDSYNYATDKDTLFYSEKVRLRFNPLDIWKENYKLKQIDILPGKLYIKVNNQGKGNYDIFKESDSEESSEFKFDLQKVKIKNLRFSYSNRMINQRYATDFIHTELKGRFTDKEFTLHAVSSQMIRETRSGQMNFVSDKSANLDIKLEVNQEKGIVKIPSTSISIANLPFEFSGYVDPSKMKFSIESKKLPLIDVVNNFTLEQVEYIKQYSGDGDFNFSLLIEDERKDEIPPSINCKFNIVKGKLIEPTQNIQVNNLSLEGEFSNKEGKGNEYLTLNNIRFNNNTGPFAGNLKITSFDAPLYQGNANGNINLQIAHSLFRIPSIEAIGGNININADFIVKQLINEDASVNFNIIKSEGSIELVNDYVQLIDDKRLFESINGKIYLKNNDVGVEDLSVKLNKSDLRLDGNFTNLVGFLKGEGKLIASMNVESNAIVVEDLSTVSKETQKESTSTRVFLLPQQIDGNLSLAIKNLSYSNHNFEQIYGSLSLSEHILRFDDIKFKTSGANVVGSILINETSEGYFQTKSTLNSSNIQLKQLMKDWNNFDQSVVKEENVFGQAAASLQLDAPFDIKNGINMKNIRADIHLKIDNGQLKGVSTFKEIVQSMNSSSAKLIIGAKNIKSFGDKLMDLRFESLENQLTIANGVITIPEMKIQSSALNIVTSGSHSFDNKIDYRFAFRLRDLKEQKDVEFGEIIDDNTGLIVYLKMFGTVDSPQFAWDKESKAEARKEYREQEKETLKSMMKSEFGLFKKDSTVQNYQENKKPKEVLEVQYGNDKDQGDEFEQQKKKKETKSNKFLDKLKQEEKKKVEVEID